MTTIQKMPDNAKLWVYQSDRAFTENEVTEINTIGTSFINDWSAHGASLKAGFEVLYNSFIILAVDEQQALASGCSIDKSVKFMKELELKYNINLFDRMQVAYRKGNEIVVCKLSAFEKLAEQGEVNENTIVFNNMVTTKASFDKEWELPLQQSWQKRVLVNS